jgi:hypothetical protein
VGATPRGPARGDPDGFPAPDRPRGGDEESVTRHQRSRGSRSAWDAPPPLATVEEQHVRRFAAELAAAWQRAHPRAAPPPRLRECAAEIALLLSSHDAGDRRLAELLRRDLWPVVTERDAATAEALLAFAIRLAGGDSRALQNGAARAPEGQDDLFAAAAAASREPAR